jgi:hypothetical protein
MLSRRTASFCIFLVACGFTPAQAQTKVAYGELYGVVTSPGRGSIPGATVTLENAATGLKRQTTTNLSGAYRFLLISPGSYEVRVERSGFRGADRKGVEVFVGQATALDVRMELGQLPQSVLVEESPATVDTQQAHPASFMGEAWIRDLPIDRRDFLTFVLLAPGVSDAKGLAGDTDLRVKQTPTSGLSFFGSNGRGNTVTVDGGEMNDGSGGVRSTISQEAAQEFQTNRGNYSAEIGGGGAAGRSTSSPNPEPMPCTDPCSCLRVTKCWMPATLSLACFREATRSASSRPPNGNSSGLRWACRFAGTTRFCSLPSRDWCGANPAGRRF